MGASFLDVRHCAAVVAAEDVLIYCCCQIGYLNKENKCVSCYCEVYCYLRCATFHLQVNLYRLFLQLEVLQHSFIIAACVGLSRDTFHCCTLLLYRMPIILLQDKGTKEEAT